MFLAERLGRKPPGRKCQPATNHVSSQLGEVSSWFSMYEAVDPNSKH